MLMERQMSWELFQNVKVKKKIHFNLNIVKNFNFFPALIKKDANSVTLFSCAPLY